jgi:circadian clock protein KaiB
MQQQWQDDFQTKRIKDRVTYQLRLFVAGTTPNSTHAIINLKRVCEKYLQGHYELQVIDLYQQPELAQGEQIIAVPTLIKKFPPPIRYVIGDLSDTPSVLAGLDLELP